MALTEGQVQIRDLVMGEGTSYRLLGFNPWSRVIRADQGGPRAWNHGSWSGAEWLDEAVVPMQIRVLGTNAASWAALHQALMVAFAPASDDVELRWVTAGREYMMRGRPRMVEPTIRALARGTVLTKAAFIALDPLLYSGELHTAELDLPMVTGGLTLPATAPLTITASVVSGRTQVTNAGTASVGLTLRIDGPVTEPRVSVLTSSGTTTLFIHLTLVAGQWLDIDTAARTVYLNGTASRRGNVSGGWPVLPTGTHELAFDAGVYDAAAQLTASWRDAWY